jgi:hypothetical protein
VPTFPLSPQALATYENLYDKLQAEIESTTDGIALTTLNDSRDEVADLLDKNDTYQQDHNTELLADLADAFKATNDNLVVLKKQIAAVAAHISAAADIIAAVDKVLTMFPGV